MVNLFKLKFHHYGLAVLNDKAALVFLNGLGYDAGENIYDPEQDVYVRLCTNADMPAVEIITKGKLKGPLNSILKRSSEMIYHVCYETENLEETLKQIEEKKLRILPVLERKKAILFNERMISFYYIVGYGLIELLENKVS